MKGSLSVIEKGKVRSITIALSRHERDLIAKHGYPFDGIEKQIELAGDKDICPITDGSNESILWACLRKRNASW